MKGLKLRLCDIYKDSESGNRYRIIDVYEGTVALYIMNPSKFDIHYLSENEVKDNIYRGVYTADEDVDEIIVDFEKLNVNVKKKFDIQLEAVKKIRELYYPLYKKLLGRSHKEEVIAVCEEYGISNTTFWRIIRKYFESGFRETSLLAERHIRKVKRKPYNYTTLPGRTPENGIKSCVCTDRHLAILEEMCKRYKSDHTLTISALYKDMIDKYFCDRNGSLKPLQDLITEKRLYDYIKKHMTKEEKLKRKMGAQQARNNARLITGDTVSNAKGPMGICEVDAWEADCYLVSEYNREKVIGKATIYVMFDEYSRCVMAFSVGLEQNSNLGLSNLFLNLFEDKVEYCRKLGLELSNAKIWPSGFKPKCIRCDRGSEFVSKEFSRICHELDIKGENCPAGTGSFKGCVEHFFDEVRKQLNGLLVGRGEVDNRYGSKHKQEACLTLKDMEKIILNVVLNHNTRYMSEYPNVKDLIDNEVDFIPYKIFEFGQKRVPCVPFVPGNKDYYALMLPIKATVSKKGLQFKDLIYDCPEDKDLLNERYDCGRLKVPKDVRIDHHNVGVLCYTRNGRLFRAGLCPGFASNEGYDGMPLKEYEENYYKARKKLNLEKQLENLQLDVETRRLNKSIIDNAIEQSPRGPADDKHITEYRHAERQADNASKSIGSKLVFDESADDSLKQLAAPEGNIEKALPVSESVPDKDAVIDYDIDEDDDDFDYLKKAACKGV